MHGWSILPQSSASTLLYLANKLGTNAVTEDEERTIQNDLRRILVLEQGTPVAVGSGAQSVKYKIHACTHSVKLTSRSWRRSCEQMTRTCTWVGDLGETGVCKFNTNLKTLMGEWVMHADAEAPDEQTFDMIGEEQLVFT